MKEHIPSFLELLPMVFVYAIMAIIFIWLVIGQIKLDTYRKYIRIGDVVNYASHYDVVFKVVVGRPGQDIVILADMDDENRTFHAPINKIYPL